MTIVVALIYFLTSSVLNVQSFILGRRVSEDSCRISLSRDLATIPSLMINESAGTLLYPTEDDVIVLAPNAEFLLYCPSGFAERRIQPRGIRVVCKRDNSVVYGNATYRINQLGCTKHPGSTLRRTGATCSQGNYTLLHVGYEYESEESPSVGGEGDDGGNGVGLDNDVDSDEEETETGRNETGNGIEAETEVSRDETGNEIRELEAETEVSVNESGDSVRVVESGMETDAGETGNGVRAVEAETEVSVDESGRGVQGVEPEKETVVDETGNGVLAVEAETKVSVGESGRGVQGVEPEKETVADETGNGVRAVEAETEVSVDESGSGIRGGESGKETEADETGNEVRAVRVEVEEDEEKTAEVKMEMGMGETGDGFRTMKPDHFSGKLKVGKRGGAASTTMNGGVQNDFELRNLKVVPEKEPTDTEVDTSVTAKESGGDSKLLSLFAGYRMRIQEGVHDVAFDLPLNFRSTGSRKLAPLVVENIRALGTFKTGNSMSGTNGRVTRDASNIRMRQEERTPIRDGMKMILMKKMFATGSDASRFDDGYSLKPHDARFTGNDVRLTESSASLTASSNIRIGGTTNINGNDGGFIGRSVTPAENAASSAGNSVSFTGNIEGLIESTTIHTEGEPSYTYTGSNLSGGDASFTRDGASSTGNGLSLSEYSANSIRSYTAFARNGHNSAGNAHDPSLTGNDPSLTGNDPSLTGNDPSLSGNDPSRTGNGPSLSRDDSNFPRNSASLPRNGPGFARSDSKHTGNAKRRDRKRPHNKSATSENALNPEKASFRRKPVGEVRFIKLIEICYDLERHRAVYASHELDERIRGRQHSVPRINFKTDIFDEEHIDVNALYTRKGQLARLTALLGSADLANEYIRRDDHFLARGHFSPKADFVHAAEQLATFYYVNVAPQWQTFNGGNWVKLEDALRDLIVKRPGKLHVYTGTHGVIALKDINDNEVEIYLGEKDGRPIVPVPKYYWKVFYRPERREGVAVVGLNNPYREVAEGDILCEDVCRAYEWLDWDTKNQDKGVMYCCALGEFQRKFIHLGLEESETVTIRAEGQEDEEDEQGERVVESTTFKMESSSSSPILGTTQLQHKM
ncbi:unnamed protein product [Bemisia tabaci]|uniref:DNA/RNA non-specific endonuclease/pyrophosphatase/phosphodiesterase domain-containing protein n=1 Tax=Bemisia tabaci TaxID=7038 RepID=A0A9P0AGG2_BEMTA|nr:unnamed protein product [Bemisia tabaci]